jgi:hypothetical protein
MTGVPHHDQCCFVTSPLEQPYELLGLTRRNDNVVRALNYEERRRAWMHVGDRTRRHQSRRLLADLNPEGQL